MCLDRNLCVCEKCFCERRRDVCVRERKTEYFASVRERCERENV